MTAGEHADTLRMHLTVSDRIALENRLDGFEALLAQHIQAFEVVIADRRAEATAFDETRMVPLENKVTRRALLLWTAVVVSLIAIALSVATLVLVAELHS